jgi:hypothetical protein
MNQKCFVCGCETTKEIIDKRVKRTDMFMWALDKPYKNIWVCKNCYEEHIKPDEYSYIQQNYSRIDEL